MCNSYNCLEFDCICALALISDVFFINTDRMLVYEYVNNGNLEQWLHGEVGLYSPLTWDIRLNIMIGTAKG